MTQSLIRKLTTLSQYEEVLVKINATVTDRLTVLKTKPQSIQRDIVTICNDPYTLAQQLTHIELSVVCCIVKSDHSISSRSGIISAYVTEDLLDWVLWCAQSMAAH
ncbi:Ras-GEF domain-containing family member 1B-A [Acipenser ruthenus]|uniref:Ras-GEF domain-containing family member 1B-A n=1 Tax=Acipenser ruthenus TaxID=7906 RepID=A0A444V0T2_ACIRT|nr:Ras-GEF domain-containing family member 1B-A [Acipenser ruthenus]